MISISSDPCKQYLYFWWLFISSANLMIFSFAMKTYFLREIGSDCLTFMNLWQPSNWTTNVSHASKAIRSLLIVACWYCLWACPIHAHTFNLLRNSAFRTINFAKFFIPPWPLEIFVLQVSCFDWVWDIAPCLCTVCLHFLEYGSPFPCSEVRARISFTEATRPRTGQQILHDHAHQVSPRWHLASFFAQSRSLQLDQSWQLQLQGWAHFNLTNLRQF